jgi:6-phosphogluconolactonase (cycloisomerase 2 family)
MREAAAMTAFHAYVGCRTSRERNARGEGLQLYRMDAETGAWRHLQLLPGFENPSFLALARTRPVLYAVHGDREAVSAFRIEAGTGRLAHLNTAPTGGRNPVHLVPTPDDRFLVVANHLTSTVALLRLDPATGAVGGMAHLLTVPGGPGPHRVQQPFAKPHQVEPDPAGRFILVLDKGADRTFTLRVDAAAGRLELVATLVHREGAGPRHIAFTPDARFAYVLNELAASLLACRYDAATGALDPFQLLPSVPDDCTGHADAAEVAVSRDGRFLYASNRGHESIGVFAIDAATGRLSPVQWVPSGGRTPRFFALDPTGRFLFAANEDSDVITGFAVDAGTGRLTPTGQEIRTGSPVCIVFRPA